MLHLDTKGKVYRLSVKQKLPITVEEAWDFLSDPKNLKTITPDYMGFQILSDVGVMYPGQIIQYMVAPVLGIKTVLVTEITHVVKDFYFVDEQRVGPYKLWHHKHFIREIPGGVEMEDIVDYRLPFGILGRFAHTLFVASKLKQIFAYRRKKLETLFGVYEK